MISIIVRQCRGCAVPVQAALAVYTLPRIGELFRVLHWNAPYLIVMEGRVKEIEHVTRLCEGGGSSVVCTYVDLDGWAHNFGNH